MSHLICKTYCPYFRDGKENVGHCQPLKFFKGLDIIEKKDYVFKNLYNDLKTLFCQKCEFFPDDCDFNNGSNGLPCGAYIYTEYLIWAGIIDIDWIRSVSKTF